jgi:hypothetical protein
MSESTDQANIDQLTFKLESTRRNLEKKFQEADHLKGKIKKEGDKSKSADVKDELKTL